jgi:hypothetical protein
MRGLTRLGIQLICLLIIAGPLQFAGAQNDEAANQKKARATLDAMVAALGGQKWLTLVSSMSQGRTSGFYQGKPTGATAEFYEFQKFPDQTRIEIGKKRDVVEIITGQDSWEITYRGKKEVPKEQLAELFRRRDHSIRTVMTTWYNDPKTILIYGGQNLVERHLADQATLINADNDSVTIQTDAETHLPLRRSFQWRDPVFKDKNTEAEEYDDYHTVDGLPTAFTVTRYKNDDMTNQRFLYRAAYNIPLTPDMFDPDQTAGKIKK